jgi:hypothetical protein
MLEEELIDLMTFCLLNPDSSEISDKHKRITEIGHELFADGGIDALENFFFVLKNRITEEIEKDPSSLRSLVRSLSSTDSENGSTACWACAFDCRFTIFHGVWFRAADFTFVTTLNTISYCHNSTRLEVILARTC